MIKCFIYGLYCPFTDSLHYIGKSTTGMVRPLSHMIKSHSEKINEWVEQLRFLGYAPIVKILEACDEINLDIREKDLINKAKDDGCYLLNMAHNSFKSIALKKEYQFDNLSTLKMGKVIRTARLLKDMRMEEVAILAQISRPTLSSIEKGLENVTLFNLDKVLHVLDLEIIITKRQILNDDENTEINTQDNSRIRATRRKNKVS